MERRDLIKDQAEQLGRVLAKILADFLGQEPGRSIEKFTVLGDEQLKDKTGIDIERIITFERKELKDYLVKKKWNAEHIETLAIYLEESGRTEMQKDSRNAQKRLKTAIDLLDIADELSQTLSLARLNRKQHIQNKLQ